MQIHNLLVGALFACILHSSAVLAVEPADLAGKYTSKVTESDGSTYEGTCTITFKARKTVELEWRYGKQMSIGTGKLKGNVLTVEYEGAAANREGDAVYQVKSKDRLLGEFKRRGTKGIGKEILIRVE